jgi:uncharacterized membrane protein YjjP (DUF1212 family)
MTSMSQASAERFVLELGQALQRYGAAAHRLEDAMTGTARRLGVRGQFFTTPTAIMASFGAGGWQHTALLRVDSGEVDLDKLIRVDRLAEGVANGEISTGEGRKQLREISRTQRPRDRTLIVLGFGLVSGAAARFFGGGLTEVYTAALIGVLSGFLAQILQRSPVRARAFEMLAALFASVVALLMARTTRQLSPEIATLAGLIVLVPGLTLTTALSELATRNLVSGSARLTAAGMTFLQIAFGVALAMKLDQRLFGPLPEFAPTALAPWTLYVALLFAGLGLALLFRAPWHLVPWVVGIGVISFWGARIGAHMLGPELGGAVGAFAVGVAGNSYARLKNRPAVVLIVPGILLLVPGSLGFRTLSFMLHHDALTGISTGFSTMLAAVSIVAGLLMANLAVSPRRAL